MWNALPVSLRKWTVNPANFTAESRPAAPQTFLDSGGAAQDAPPRTLLLPAGRLSLNAECQLLKFIAGWTYSPEQITDLAPVVEQKPEHIEVGPVEPEVVGGTSIFLV